MQNDFVKKLSPIVEQIAVEKGLHLVFNASESGIAWAAPGLDLTADVIKKLDGQAKPATAKGIYIEGVVLSATMSPGIPLDIKEFISA